MATNTSLKEILIVLNSNWLSEMETGENQAIQKQGQDTPFPATFFYEND